MKDYYVDADGNETWDAMIKLYGIEKFKAFCLLNIFKYRMRAGKKTEDFTSDMEKALEYERMLKKLSLPDSGV
jgi:hypothetical protein